MRNTRLLVAEQAQRIINGGSPSADTEVRAEELAIYVDQAFGQLIQNAYYENMSEGSRYVPGTFIYSFVEPVQYDTIRKRYTVSLSSSYVQLPHGIGVYQVSAVEDETSTFKPLNSNFLAMASGLAVGDLEGNRGYMLEAGKLVLVNLKADDKFENILIKLAGGIQGDVDPTVDIPLDMQGELVRLTVELYMIQQQMPNDDINDNTKE